MTIKRIVSVLFLLLGFISLGIGIAGTVFPVLPGFPFYLFAAFCFAKGSKKMERWFKSSTLYKKYVERFLNEKAMTKKEKIRINLIADTFILISIITVDILVIQIFMVIIALYKHYYFIKKIKTIHPKYEKRP